MEFNTGYETVYRVLQYIADCPVPRVIAEDTDLARVIAFVQEKRTKHGLNRRYEIEKGERKYYY